MTESGEGEQEARARTQVRVRLAHLEADLAYFRARIEILGEPMTANQMAQRRAFTALYAMLAKGIVRTGDKGSRR
jgi:hypothetical protein